MNQPWISCTDFLTVRRPLDLGTPPQEIYRTARQHWPITEGLACAGMTTILRAWDAVGRRAARSRHGWDGRVCESRHRVLGIG